MCLNSMFFFAITTLAFGVENSATEMVNIPKGVTCGADPDFGVMCLTNAVPFLMDSTEVTQERWQSVCAWATNNNKYIFDSDINGVGSKGKRSPAFGVTFFNALLWCNARSEREGLTACYLTTKGKPSRLYNERITRCDFGASGYRLPTVCEWEYAVRAGTCTRFYCGNYISQRDANYCGGSNIYDVAEKNRFHPEYSKGEIPYVSPVAAFTPNAYGLYDMMGNVSEWCWHSESEKLQSFHYAILKGGSWRSNANHLRSGCVVIFESGGHHVSSLKFTGLRCVMRGGGVESGQTDKREHADGERALK